MQRALFGRPKTNVDVDALFQTRNVIRGFGSNVRGGTFSFSKSCLTHEKSPSLHELQTRFWRQRIKRVNGGRFGKGEGGRGDFTWAAAISSSEDMGGEANE